MYGTPLVIGCDGLIGHALFDYLLSWTSHVIGTTRRIDPLHLNLNLEEDSSLWVLPDSVRLAYLCAGITGVKACEADPVRTRYINVERMQVLIDKLLAHDVHVVFLSSDLATSSSSEYGAQKRTLEKYLEGKRSTIVRLGKVLSHKTGRLRDWIKALKAGRRIESYTDYYFSPIRLQHVLAILGDKELLGAHSNILICGSESLSYFDAIDFIAEHQGLDRTLIIPKSSGDFLEDPLIDDANQTEFRFSTWDTLKEVCREAIH